MSGPIRIVDAHGVHPHRLDQSVLEERLYKEGRIQLPRPDMIFVFGSNEAGIHGAGAARHAMNHHGAKMGTSFGPAGHSFAIPTKDAQIRHTLPLREIKQYVNAFLVYAANNPALTFQVTALGTGLAGLPHEPVATMFFRGPSNCLYDTVWEEYLPARAKFWGTF